MRYLYAKVYSAWRRAVDPAAVTENAPEASQPVNDRAAPKMHDESTTGVDSVALASYSTAPALHDDDDDNDDDANAGSVAQQSNVVACSSDAHVGKGADASSFSSLWATVLGDLGCEASRDRTSDSVEGCSSCCSSSSGGGVSAHTAGMMLLEVGDRKMTPEQWLCAYGTALRVHFQSIGRDILQS